MTSRYPEPGERITVQHRLPRPDPRAATVVRHVSKGWMPASPGSLERIQRALEQRSPQLVPVIKKEVAIDPGLFSWVMRSLRRAEAAVPSALGDPLETLGELSYEELCRLFTSPQSAISSYSFSRALSTQRATIRLASRASVAAETVAAAAQQKSTLVSSATHLRSLGLNLISWNYPRIFSQCVARASTTHQPLESELTRALGVHPHDVVKKLSAAWPISFELRAAIQGHDPVLSQICAGAELYARAQEERLFPKAAEQWEQFQAQAPELFSKAIVERIEQAANEAMAALNDAFDLERQPPEQREPLIVVIPEPLHNPSLESSNEAVQELYAGFYTLIEPGAPAPEALKDLVERVIPALGFIDGCLFLMGKDQTLQPAMRLGPSKLARYAALTKERGTNLIASPYSWNTFKGYYDHPERGETLALSSGFINSKQPAVLYLEQISINSVERTQAAVKLFDTVHFALAHALGELLWC